MVHSIGIFNGYILWIYSMGIFNGYIQWVYSMGIFNGYIQWIYASDVKIYALFNDISHEITIEGIE